MSNTTEIVKIRGFTLTSEQALASMNHVKMIHMLKDWVVQRKKQTVKTTSFRMLADRKSQSVRNCESVKIYRNDTFDKRRLPNVDEDANPSFLTMPYGAKHDKFADFCT